MSENLLIDQTWRSKRLEELEFALNTVVSPQKFRPTSRGDHADGVFGYRGQIDLGVFRVRIGRAIEVALAPEEADDRMAFVVSAAGTGQYLTNGKAFPISKESAVVFTSGPLRSLCFLDDTEKQVLIMDRRKLAECCAKLLGCDIPGFLDFEIGQTLDTPGGRSWMRLLNHAEAELSDPDALIRKTSVAWRQFEQSLLTGFLLSHRHAFSDALLRPQSAALPFYVKRAEAYIEAHFAEPLSLADIAAVAGVSARSLQNGFQGFRAMTPMAFLRMVRLRHVRQALLQADPASTTVTAVALACGFGHMGEFTTLYRRTYGETPREILQRVRRG